MIPGVPCGTGLPVAKALDVYHFYRFVELQYQLDNMQAKGRASLQLSGASSSKLSVVDPGRRGLWPVLGPQGSLMQQPAAQPLAVVVKDVDTLLATRRLKTPEGEFSLTFTSSAVHQLLAGQPTVLSGQLIAQGNVGKAKAAPASSRSLIVSAPQDNEPVTLAISNLESFLAEPSLDVGGAIVPVHLTAAQIRGLRRGASAVVEAPGLSVRLEVAQAPPPVAAPANAPVAPGAGPLPGGVSLVPAGLQISPGVAVPIVLWLPWNQTWSLVGYARGEILNSLSLAPQEDLKIEVFSWDRRTTTTEQTSSVDASNNLDVSDTTRSSADVMNELVSRNQVSWDAKANLSVNLFGVVTIGGGGGVSSQQSLADTVKTTTSVVHEATSRSSSTVKQSRQTKISQTEEVGSETRVTRTLQNPNKCRTLNLDFFEVIANWEVTTAFSVSDARLCALLDNPVKVPFNRATVREYETTLRRALLDANLADGFAAARLLDARDRACDVLCNTCTCPGTNTGNQNWVPDLTLVLNNATVLRSQSPYAVFDYIDSTQPGSTPVPILQTEARWWGYWMTLLHGAVDVADVLGRFNTPPADATEALQLTTALQAAGGLSALDPGALLKQWHDQLILDANEAFFTWANPNGWQWDWIKPAVEVVFASLDDGGLTVSLSTFLTDYAAVQQSAAAAAQASQNATDAINSAWPVQTVTEAAERLDALLNHLQVHADYYRYSIYQELAATGTYNPASGQAIAEFVEPRSVGFVGCRIAFPIRADIAAPLLDPLITNNPDIQDVSETENMILPTSAVVCESRLGECEGCEPFIEQSREIELRLRSAEADQADEETKRLEARLAANPPLLDDPDCCDDSALRVEIVNPAAKPGA